MFRIFFVIALCISIKMNSFGQKKGVQNFIKIIYKMSYQLDSLNNTDSRIELMELLYNDSISIFQSVGIGMIDSMNYEGQKHNPNYNVRNEKKYATIPRPKVHYVINRLDNVIDVFDTYKYGGLRSDGYQHYVERMELDWNMTRKTDTLLGYFVQQAFLQFGGREWECWFAPSIPISAGPYKFYGLPGLIIKIKDKTNSWEFSINSIENDVYRAVFDKSKAIPNITKTDKMSFFQSRNHYLQNRTIIDEQNGDIIILSSESRKELIKNDKVFTAKNNNWIELFP